VNHVLSLNSVAEHRPVLVVARGTDV